MLCDFTDMNLKSFISLNELNVDKIIKLNIHLWKSNHQICSIIYMTMTQVAHGKSNSVNSEDIGGNVYKLFIVPCLGYGI